MRNEIQEQIKEKEKNIKRVLENIKIEEEKVRLQIKSPRPINPQFEFEIDEEYLKNVVKSLQLEWDRKKFDMLEAVENAREDVKDLKRELKLQTDYTG